MKTFDDATLDNALHGDVVWIDVGDHTRYDAVAARRAQAELAHAETCGAVCSPHCGAAWELVGMAGVSARVRGGLIAPRSRAFTLDDTSALVMCGVGASCQTMVIDDLGALLAQGPTPDRWHEFAQFARAADADGVRVWLLGSHTDANAWPEGLPSAGMVRRGLGWRLFGDFGPVCLPRR